MLGQLEKRGYFLGLGGREVGPSLLRVPSEPWGDRQDTFQRTHSCHSRKLGLLAMGVWCDQSQVQFILTMDLRKCDM